MGKVRQINIINPTYYFCNDQIDLKDFDARLLKIDKRNYSKVDSYYIGYVAGKKFANCNNINSVNPLFLMNDQIIGHFECNSIECNSSIQEKHKCNYLVLNDVDENKEVLKNIKKSRKVLKKKLKQLMVAKKLNMGKIFKKLGLSLMMIYH